MAQERLDRALAGTGRWSRKEIRDLIRQGRVQVDGAVVTRPETKICPETAQVRFGAETVSLQPFVYVMMHKPEGVLSATEDARRKTVLDLLPEPLRRRGLFPVGRLDQDSTGLMLLTDDGPMGHALLSPRRHVDKVYLVELEGQADGTDVQALASGMILGDGLRCLPARLELLDGGGRCLVTLREGKYHQVKRMLAARGKPVRSLKRLSMGPLRLDEGLAPGQWRMLTAEEMAALRQTTGRDAL